MIDKWINDRIDSRLEAILPEFAETVKKAVESAMYVQVTARESEPNGDRLLDIREVAYKLGVSKSKLENLIREGSVPKPIARTNRSKRLWRLSDINRYIAN